MSGAVGLNIIPVTSNVEPKEGSKACVVNLLWNNSNPFGTYNINLLQQYNTGQFVDVQSVFIDNSTCPYQVTLFDNQTGHTIKAPPFSQGMYPIITGANPSYIATLNYVIDLAANAYFQNVTTKLFFLNSPQFPTQTLFSEFGNNFSNYTQSGEQFTAGKLLLLMPQFITTGLNLLITNLTVTAFVSPAVSANESVDVIFYEMTSAQNFQSPSATNYERLIVSLNISNGFQASIVFSQAFDPPILFFNQNYVLGATCSVTGTILKTSVSYGTVLIA